MKKVLVGFKQSSMIKQITKFVHAEGSEELQFATVLTKSRILEAIRKGGYDVVILMGKNGRDEWTAQELIHIKDNYAVNLIPIISEDYHGKPELSGFCNHGITNAVFISQKNQFNVEEIYHMIYRSRLMKDARVYYGLSTIGDIRGAGNILDEATYERVHNAVLDNRAGEPMGIRFVNAIGGLTPSQVGDFLKRLDDPTLNLLKNTVEYYDVLEVLKKNKVVKSYHVPREIKKMRRGEQTSDLENVEGAVTVGDSDVQYEKEVIDMPVQPKMVQEQSPAASADYDEDEDEDFADFADDDEDDYSYFANSMVASFNKQTEDDEDEDDDDEDPGDDTEDDFAIVFAEEPTDGDEFTFANFPIKSAESQPVMLEKRGSEAENESTDSWDKEGEDRKDRKRGKKSKKPDDLLEDEPESEEEKKSERNTRIIIGICTAACIAFFALLTASFFAITAKRRAEENAASQNTGYDKLYSEDDVARYEVGETGNVILKDEDGNVLYEGDSSGIDEQDTQLGQENEEEILVDVVNELQPDNETIHQTYNDVSGFEAQKDYKGLDLVNQLNGDMGADCTLKMKNGAVIEIKRGTASIEEFRPSAIYECNINGSELIFLEK